MCLADGRNTGHLKTFTVKQVNFAASYFHGLTIGDNFAES